LVTGGVTSPPSSCSLAAAVACYLPARQAGRLNPISILRD
jgi:ABC-type lipoprotein release transport system permease subunit